MLSGIGTHRTHVVRSLTIVYKYYGNENSLNHNEDHNENHTDINNYKYPRNHGITRKTMGRGRGGGRGWGWDVMWEKRCARVCGEKGVGDNLLE